MSEQVLAWFDGKLVRVTEAEARSYGLTEVTSTRGLDHLAKGDPALQDALTVARRRGRNRRKRERRGRR